MLRRRFIALLGGVVAWPLAVRAQRSTATKRVGVLMSLAETDPEGQARLFAFLDGLGRRGWVEGRNLRIDLRWTAGDAERIRTSAAELVKLVPDVILASGGSVVGPMIQANSIIPIVFAQVTDPVEAGYVSNLARPGGNVTGFLQLEYGLSQKWLELLREIAPDVKHIAVIRDSSIPAGKGLFEAIHSIAPRLGVDVIPASVRDVGEMERVASEVASRSNGGVIVTPSALALVRRDMIIALAAQHQLPAIYPQRFFVAAGGLISYGPDLVDQMQQAAGYVDRIFKGEKPGDLPVQAPVKFDTAINLKTARALGLAVPPPLLARADEVIE